MCDCTFDFGNHQFFFSSMKRDVIEIKKKTVKMGIGFFFLGEQLMFIEFNNMK